jgi:hypothetical protein
VFGEAFLLWDPPVPASRFPLAGSYFVVWVANHASSRWVAQTAPTSAVCPPRDDGGALEGLVKCVKEHTLLHCPPTLLPGALGVVGSLHYQALFSNMFLLLAWALPVCWAGSPYFPPAALLYTTPVVKSGACRTPHEIVLQYDRSREIFLRIAGSQVQVRELHLWPGEKERAD